MKKIILDTDLGSDCDDCGALSLLHNLEKDGKCDILAVMCNMADEYSPIAVKSINSWFGNDEIPIAQTNGNIFKGADRVRVYTKYLADEYLASNPKPHLHDVVTLYRQLLATNNDVSIISVGFLNNIAELLESAPDNISPFSGIELVKNSASKIYIMGGNFSVDEQFAEYNILTDIPSAQIVSQKCPVPIVYLGWEVGMCVFTGHTLWSGSMDNPVKKAYEIYAKHYNKTKADGTFDRMSWDPLTAYYGVTNDTSFMHESTPKTITFDNGGLVKVDEGGKDTYLILDDIKKAEERIEELIL